MAALQCLVLLLLLVLMPVQVKSSQEFSSPYEWKMTCDDFMLSRYSILIDNKLPTQAKRKLIKYLRSKVVGDCTTQLS
jgi:hypothetical protein